MKESSPNGSTYYYYGTGGNLVGLKKNNTTYIVHDNLRGDIESITDTNGSIVAQYHYDPWGNQITYSGTLTQSFRYAGYYYDDETGLYYLKSRYYSPVLGRFLTRDGIGYVDFADPQTLNRYSYVRNNPVSLRDPNGNWMEGDESLPGWAQDVIIGLGKDWKSATAEEKAKIHQKAENVRKLCKVTSALKAAGWDTITDLKVQEFWLGDVFLDKGKDYSVDFIAKAVTKKLITSGMKSAVPVVGQLNAAYQTGSGIVNLPGNVKGIANTGFTFIDSFGIHYYGMVLYDAREILPGDTLVG